MENLFGQSQALWTAELDWMKGQLDEARQKVAADGEKMMKEGQEMAQQTTELVRKNLTWQADAAMNMAKHTADLYDRQLKLIRQAFGQAA
jgi:hypothetical protein